MHNLPRVRDGHALHTSRPNLAKKDGLDNQKTTHDVMVMEKCFRSLHLPKSSSVQELGFKSPFGTFPNFSSARSAILVLEEEGNTNYRPLHILEHERFKSLRS